MDVATYVAGIGTALAAQAAGHFFVRLRERQSSRSFQNRVLAAIRVELEMLLEINARGIGKLLAQVPKGQILMARLEITQNYFSVFEANAEHLGKLDQKISRLIITIYARMKMQVDNYRIHNGYLDRHEHPVPNEYFIKQTNTFLLESTNQLRSLDLEIKNLIHELFRILDECGIHGSAS